MRYLIFAVLMLPSFLVVADLEDVVFIAALSKPYGFYSTDNKPAGMVVDYAHSLSDESKVNFDLYLAPPPRVYREMANGKADLSILPEGELADKVAERIGVATEAFIVVVGLSENDREVQSLGDLQGKNVGYVKGIPYGASFSENSGIIKVPLLSTQIGIEMLLKKRVDYILSSERTLAYHLMDKKLGDKVRLVYRLSKARSYLYVSKKSPHKEVLKARFSKIISSWYKNNKVHAMYGHLRL